MASKNLTNGVIEMAGTVRLRGDLASRLNRRGPEALDKYAVQGQLRAALPTAENWAEDPGQYTRIDLDHLFRYLVGVLGIPERELLNMRFGDIFEIKD